MTIEQSAEHILPTVKRKRAAPAQAVLVEAGLESILARIRAGESQREIAAGYRVDVSTLNRFLRLHPDETRAAMVESAEAWLDRGMQELEKAKGKDNAEVARARAVALECARRAAIRNPRYSEKQSVELSGPDGGPMPHMSQVVVYVPANNRDEIVSDEQ